MQTDQGTPYPAYRDPTLEIDRGRNEPNETCRKSTYTHMQIHTCRGSILIGIFIVNGTYIHTRSKTRRSTAPYRIERMTIRQSSESRWECHGPYVLARRIFSYRGRGNGEAIARREGYTGRETRGEKHGLVAEIHCGHASRPACLLLTSDRPACMRRRKSKKNKKTEKTNRKSKKKEKGGNHRTLVEEQFLKKQMRRSR